MAAVLWVTTCSIAILAFLHVANTYVLLTANMDDVQAIAKQMLESPVAEQIGKIWRRASAQFSQQLKRTSSQKRASEGVESDSSSSDSSTGSRSKFLRDSFRRRGRRVLNDLSELSRNATEYLESLRRVFNKFTKQ